MYPATAGAEQGQTGVFYFVLIALFIVGLGFSLQQTAANPFAIALGDPKTGSHRLNLAGGINSFGTTIGPVVVSLVIFGSASWSTDELAEMIRNNEITLVTVQGLYLGVGALFLLAAALFHFSKKLPVLKSETAFEPANKARNLLIVLTIVIVGCFGYIFNTYSGNTEATEDLEHTRLIVLFIALSCLFAMSFFCSILTNLYMDSINFSQSKYSKAILFHK